MSGVFELEQAQGRRRLAESDFPIAVGGPNSDIPLTGVSATETAAWLGLSDGELFVQPKGAEPVLCNGARVTTSQWLRDGDVVRVASARITVEVRPEGTRLEVNALGEEHSTEPPVIVTSGSERSSEVAETVTAVEFKPRPIAAGRRRRFGIRLAVVVFWFVLAVLGGVAWFVLTASPVEIHIEPAPERVELRGFLAGVKIGERHLLRPGTYTLIAEKAGYHRLEVPVEIEGRDDEVLSFTLEMLPGFLSVDAGSLTGAEVFIDGERVGVTPIDRTELVPGEHAVRVSAERYIDFLTTVTIDGQGSVHNLSVELTPGWAEISFASTPSGATVRVDGRAIGSTPLSHELSPGTRRYEMTLEGYKPHRGSVTVVADEGKSVPVATLVKLDATLRVASEPPGASVAVDETFRGLTPLEIVVPPDRSYEIEVTKAGYELAVREVRAVPGEISEVAVTLTPQVGEIHFIATPDDAELVVDGKAVGPANQVLRLAAVPHEIVIRKEGYRDFRTTVTPRTGFPQSVEVALETEEEVKARKTPPSIRSPQGQKLILIDGGRLQMGASRREPGRRANETLRDVELTRRFYLSVTEVSNHEFREFQGRHVSGQVGGVNLEIDDHPVVRVTWEDAARYCNWLSEKDGLPPVYVERGGDVVGVRPVSLGYRLPTEAEWAWAARHAGRDKPLKYPWGDSLPVAGASGNYADESAGGLLGGTLDGYEDPYPATAPVDSFRPNDIGLLNVGGNVAEWVHDIYTIYASTPGVVELDPLGPEEGDLHVIRGSSWMDDSVSELRLTYRDHGGNPRPDVGFRIARYAE